MAELHPVIKRKEDWSLHCCERTFAIFFLLIPLGGFVCILASYQNTQVVCYMAGLGKVGGCVTKKEGLLFDFQFAPRLGFKFCQAGIRIPLIRVISFFGL